MTNRMLITTISLTFIQLLHICSSTPITTQKITSFTKREINFNFSIDFIKLLFNKSSQSFKSALIKEKICHELLFNQSTKENYPRFQLMTKYSGKGPNELGNKDLCEEVESEIPIHNMFHFVIEYKYRLSNKMAIKFYDHLSFSGKLNKYYIGICFPNECNEFVDLYFNAEVNQQALDFIADYFHREDFIIVKSNKISTTTYPYMWIVQCFLITYYSFIAILCIYWIISSILITSINKEDLEYNSIEKTHFNRGEINHFNEVNIIKKDKTNTKSEHNIVEKKNNNNNNNNYNNIELDNNTIDRSSTTTEIKLEDILYTQQKKQRTQQYDIKKKILLLDKYLNLKNYFNYLFDEENYLYNQKELGIFSFIRFIIMIFITYQIVFYMVLTLPSGKDDSLKFFSPTFTAIARLTSLSYDLLICLEGALFIYKLMNFISKHEKRINDVCFSTIMKFTVRIFTKMITFFTTFFIFYILFYEMDHYMLSSSSNRYFNRIYFNKKYCFNNPWVVLVPLMTSYNCFGASSDMTNSISSFACFPHVTVISNVFWCCILTTFIVYFSLKLKSRLFDYTLNIICLAILLTNYFFLDYIDFLGFNFPTNATIDYMNGEKIFHYFFHSCFANFYMGVNVGMVLFYYQDLVKNCHYYVDYDEEFSKEKNKLFKLTFSNKKSINKPYLFLSSNFYLMRSLSNISSFMFRSIMLICFACIILISFFYSIFSGIDGNFSFKITKFHYVVYSYEKIICTILFALILLLCVICKTSDFSKIVNVNIFIIFERISFTYICILESNITIEMSIIMQEINYSVTITNILFFSLCLLFSCTIQSFFLTAFLEIPFRVLIKRLLRDENDVKSITE